jgi:hypothetical protein
MATKSKTVGKPSPQKVMKQGTGREKIRGAHKAMIATGKGQTIITGSAAGATSSANDALSVGSKEFGTGLKPAMGTIQRVAR